MTYMQNRTICENYDKIYNNMAKQKYQYVQNMTKYDKFNKKWSIQKYKLYDKICKLRQNMRKYDKTDKV